MSTHDRGTFGKLLAEAKALGARKVVFSADLDRADEDHRRWEVYCTVVDYVGTSGNSSGRTGEEALRGMVESLRVWTGVAREPNPT